MDEVEKMSTRRFIVLFTAGLLIVGVGIGLFATCHLHADDTPHQQGLFHLHYDKSHVHQYGYEVHQDGSDVHLQHFHCHT